MVDQTMVPHFTQMTNTYILYLFLLPFHLDKSRNKQIYAHVQKKKKKKLIYLSNTKDGRWDKSYYPSWPFLLTVSEQMAYTNAVLNRVRRSIPLFGMVVQKL